MEFTIRKSRPDDAGQIAEICVLTGAAGEDARGIEDDLSLLPAIFAEPYLEHSPQCAWVLEDRVGVCGYALGVADSRGFADWMETDWWPDLRLRHRDPGPARSAWRASDRWRRWVHHPPHGQLNRLGAWPAHGHIDLLARARGGGAARPLMLRMMASVYQSGAGGIHLGVATANQRALRFYHKLGFLTVAAASDEETTTVARALPVGAEPATPA